MANYAEIPAALLNFLKMAPIQMPQLRSGPVQMQQQQMQIPNVQAPQLNMKQLQAPQLHSSGYGKMAMQQGAARRREERQEANAIAALEQEAAARRQYYADNPNYDPYHAMQNAPTAAGRAAAAKMMQDQNKPVTRAMSEYEILQKDPDAWRKMNPAPYRAPDRGTSLVQNLRAMGIDPLSPEGQKIMRDNLTKSAVTVNNQGNIPSGYMREAITTPEGTQTVLKPQVGSKDYIQANEGYTTAQRGVNTVSEMRDLISEHGPEAWGKVSGEMGQKYGQIMAIVAKLQDKGVLQKGEVEMIQSQLTDPSATMAHGTSRATMLAQYDGLLADLEGRLTGLGQKFDTWGYDRPGVKAPTNQGGLSDAQERRYQELLRKEASGTLR